MKKTWAFLRHLLNPLKDKTDQFHPLQKLIDKTLGSVPNLINQLRKIYILEGEQAILPEYHGPENTFLYEDITEAEVGNAIKNVRPGSAPGPDAITNKMLRNLDDPSIADLTAYYNYYWRTGELPKEWKSAKISFIPKPGKPIALENLTPISLTSCVGKVLEHITLARITHHINQTNALPCKMVVFRPKLSPQDILLQLSNEVIQPTS